MSFWFPAAAIVVLLGLAFGLTGLRAARRTAGAAGTTAAHDMAVWRAQMAELDREAAQGTLDADEAGRARTRIGRRLLEADRALRAGTGAGAPGKAAPPRATWALSAGLALVLAGGVWGYLRLGAPGDADQPIAARRAAAETLYATRPTQAEAEETAARLRPAPPPADPQFLSLMAQLRQTVAARPEDATGQDLLARNELALGHYAAARAAQQRLIALRGAGAGPADYARLGEIDASAAGGLITADAESAFEAALARDPQDGRSLYYMGLMMAQNGRPDRAFALWDAALSTPESDSAPDASWLTAIRDNIGALAQAAGVPGYRLPAAGPPSDGSGPDAADIAAAGQMSAADRAGMIRGMVARLDTRLHREGGSAADWARLVSSLRAIGEVDRADAAAAEARAQFAADPQALAQIETARNTPLPASPRPAPPQGNQP